MRNWAAHYERLFNPKHAEPSPKKMDSVTTLLLGRPCPEFADFLYDKGHSNGNAGGKRGGSGLAEAALLPEISHPCRTGWGTLSNDRRLKPSCLDNAVVGSAQEPVALPGDRFRFRGRAHHVLPPANQVADGHRQVEHGDREEKRSKLVRGTTLLSSCGLGGRRQSLAILYKYCKVHVFVEILGEPGRRVRTVVSVVGRLQSARSSLFKTMG